MFHCFQQLVLVSSFVSVLMGSEQVEHFSAALTLKCIPVVFSSQGLNTVFFLVFLLLTTFWTHNIKNDKGSIFLISRERSEVCKGSSFYSGLYASDSR